MIVEKMIDDNEKRKMSAIIIIFEYRYNEKKN